MTALAGWWMCRAEWRRYCRLLYTRHCAFHTLDYFLLMAVVSRTKVLAAAGGLVEGSCGSRRWGWGVGGGKEDVPAWRSPNANLQITLNRPEINLRGPKKEVFQGPHNLLNRPCATDRSWNASRVKEASLETTPRSQNSKLSLQLEFSSISRRRHLQKTLAASSHIHT